MNDALFDINGLSFQYRKGVLALTNVDFTINRGEVLGILGHNGSGKSTLLKLLSGIFPSVDSIHLEGKPLHSYAASHLYRRIGVLIERPGFYPHLSLERNLKLLADYRQLGPTAVADIVDRLSLAPILRKRMSGFSTGMRQRSGIAMALLGNPEVVILDEPINGLDIGGILEIRHLIKQLTREGKTVIVTSHILQEMEKISDTMLVLSEGKVIFHGPKEQLLEDLTGHYTLVTSDPDATESVLTTMQVPFQMEEARIDLQIPQDSVPELTRNLVAAGIGIYELTPTKPTLESVYWKMMQHVGD